GAFEWSPDGKNIAYLTTDPTPKEKPIVIHVDAPTPPTRLAVRAVSGGAARMLTPPAHYVDSFDWSPDGKEIAYAAAPISGFNAQYQTRVYAIAASGGAPRAIVERPGMNGRPLYSPDGRSIAFVSSNGRSELMAPRSLAIVAAAGGAPRMLQNDGTWVNDFVWTRDSKALDYEANEGTFASGEQMFEQPIVRLGVEAGLSRPEPVKTGTVNYSISLSNDGRRLAYRSVDGRTMATSSSSTPRAAAAPS